MRPDLRRRRRRCGAVTFRVVLAGVGVSLAVISGCASSDSRSGGAESRARSRPNASMTDPSKVRSTVVMAALPEDRDGDGYPDQYPVIVLLFGDGELPIMAPGAIVAELRLPNGEALRRWVVPEENLSAAAKEFPPGPGFDLGFRLELGADRRPRSAADLLVWFVPSGLDPRDPESLKRSTMGRASLNVGGGFD